MRASVRVEYYCEIPDALVEIVIKKKVEGGHMKKVLTLAILGVLVVLIA